MLATLARAVSSRAERSTASVQLSACRLEQGCEWLPSSPAMMPSTRSRSCPAGAGVQRQSDLCVPSRARRRPRRRLQRRILWVRPRVRGRRPNGGLFVSIQVSYSRVLPSCLQSYPASFTCTWPCIRTPQDAVSLTCKSTQFPTGTCDGMDGDPVTPAECGSEAHAVFGEPQFIIVRLAH